MPNHVFSTYTAGWRGEIQQKTQFKVLPPEISSTTEFSCPFFYFNGEKSFLNFGYPYLITYRRNRGFVFTPGIEIILLQSYESDHQSRCDPGVTQGQTSKFLLQRRISRPFSPLKAIEKQVDHFVTQIRRLLCFCRAFDSPLHTCLRRKLTEFTSTPNFLTVKRTLYPTRKYRFLSESEPRGPADQESQKAANYLESLFHQYSAVAVNLKNNCRMNIHNQSRDILECSVFYIYTLYICIKSQQMSEFYKGRILLQFETDREDDPVGKVQGRFGSFVSLINFGLCNIISLAAKLKKKALQRECLCLFSTAVELFTRSGGN